DGPLTTADVFDLNLGAAFMSLSACETGRAALGGGDELAGLARAFLYAGASGLLVSQWRGGGAPPPPPPSPPLPLPPRPARARLYQSLAGQRDALSPAEALRAAQTAYIRGAEMRQRTTSHPFYWAGFQIIGG